MISLLLLSALLLVLTMGLLRGVTSQSWRAGQHLEKTAAAYVAEAGLSQALSRLSINPSWRAGFSYQLTRWGQGTYSLHFQDTGPWGSEDSVNNLDHDTPCSAPKGNLPPFSAYLVVVGQVGMTRRTLEAVVGRRTLESVGGPLLAQGPIQLFGNTQVLGLESYAGAATPVQVHSNFAGQVGQPTISWQPSQAGDQLNVAGNLTAVDNRDPSEVFDLAGPYSATGTYANQPTLNPPDLNVPAEVSLHTGATAPTFTGLQTVLPPGDYYLNSDTSYAGNIVLQNGANLYVNGNLDVTGTITGQGTVFIDGNARLSGTAEVSSANRVALAAQGDVTLEGFNGNQYLKNIPGATPILNDIKRVTEEMDYWLSHAEDPPPSLITSWPNMPAGGIPGWASFGVLGNWGALDRLNQSLGGDMHGDGSSPAIFFPDVPSNRVGALMDLVSLQPPSSQKTFVLSQLQKLREFTRWTVPMSSKQDKRDEFMANPRLDCPAAFEGLFDTLGELDLAAQRRGLQAARNVISNFSVDRLGDAHFEGLVYARGRIRARNQLQVRGGLVAAGGPSSSVILENGSKLTWIKDYFGRGPGAIVFNGGLSLRHWCLR